MSIEDIDLLNFRRSTFPSTNSFLSTNQNVKSTKIISNEISSWIEDSGNYLFIPSNVEIVGVIHFLGGAFVGAAPHLTYKYFLENLASYGYIVVTTPYDLTFDYISICDDILVKFDAVGPKLAEEYGPLPVIGIGHSCGALLQTLITSLFPDIPRAINILISYNNRPAKDAIPLFNELIVPLSEQLVQNKELQQIIRESQGKVSNYLDEMKLSSIFPSLTTTQGNNILSIIKQTVHIANQIPSILNMIGKGKREFIPTPNETKDVCRKLYRARSTLILKFKDDNLDDSIDIEKLLLEANEIMKVKRPNVKMDVELKLIQGTHITPLTQNINIELSSLPLLIPRPIPSSLAIPTQVLNSIDSFTEDIRIELQDNFLQTINDVSKEITQYLDRTVKVKGSYKSLSDDILTFDEGYDDFVLQSDSNIHLDN